MSDQKKTGNCVTEELPEKEPEKEITECGVFIDKPPIPRTTFPTPPPPKPKVKK